MNTVFVVVARSERGCADDDDARIRPFDDAGERVVDAGAVLVAWWS